ncbi:MAG: oxygen-independent coproporphyrinogen III oxidase, partial [Bdellovibrionales bacterium]|nr:oxygen-independent coproporphyrinogen III oxidase [Bdellovibrionales bacterium]
MNYSDLLKKYDVPAPRYTSYPTVPYWANSPSSEQWIESLVQAFATKKAVTWSLYIHIPFCETLCTFCGCNTSITKNHDKEIPYLENLHREFSLYKERVPAIIKQPLRELHLGGGSPTFFSAKNLVRLLEPLLNQLNLKMGDFEAGIEVDPRRTTSDQLVELYRIGFRRISLGVQDFNPETQRLVNRIQPYTMTKQIYDWARSIGYDSINFDLIYGLPLQTPESVCDMARKTVGLRPDRIALYSFARVPWIKPAQRLFKDEDLPAGAEKRKLYELAREILIEGGYVEIGMDHFALPSDGLARAQAKGELHRNFMGYTDKRTQVLLGLGVSAISESPTCFHQNEKVLNIYERKLSEGLLPTFRGHLLDKEDQIQREKILQFMTRG